MDISILIWIGAAVLPVLLLTVWVVVSIADVKKQRIAVDNAYAQLRGRLTERSSCVPKIVELVRGYDSSEQGAFDAALDACKGCDETTESANFDAALQGLNGCIEKVLAASKGYPKLEADREFLKLKSRLADTETELQSAKRHYNGLVREYNRKGNSVPAKFFKGLTGFSERKEIEMQASKMSDAVPKIDFG